MTRRPLVSLMPVLMLLCLALPLAAQEDADCLECHDDLADGLLVTESHPFGGAHFDLSCIDCHAEIEDLPHDEEMPGVDCAMCHDDVADIYQVHGRGIVGESDYIPTCVDCHGTHMILSATDQMALTNPLNLPRTCGVCHEDSALIEDLNIKFKHPIRVYEKSIHGQATAGGIHQAASCNDCHSTEGTSHMILPPSDSRSTISFFNIPKTCGQCHNSIEQDYWEGAHGAMTARGEVDAPICTNCHGEHGILSPDDPRSPVSPYRLAEATCTPCHESAALNEKYELPTGRLESYVDSYHGLKSKAGDLSVANCASCHGAHLILESGDERSSINPKNLAQTCGNCHPGISEDVAAMPIHATATGHRSGATRIVQIIYLVLIFCVIGGMALHWLVDLFKRIHDVVHEKPQVRRMQPGEVVQHTVLAVSFTALVISGFALRFYDAWWSEMIFGREGGFAIRGLVHRISAIIMVLGSVWHLIFLFTPRGRGFIRDMMPNLDDFRQFLLRMRFNVGLTGEHPRFGRFSYVEKAEYWALIWGTVVMALTGFCLWFDNFLVQYLPQGLLDVFLVIHYYEAWLAFLAILIWHMYSTIFNPEVYPMNPSWITGKMPLRQYEAEHPLVEPVDRETVGMPSALVEGPSKDDDPAD